ncbi:hypothetical protein HPB51_005241 [Rhipicephalus microplus]|uniref:Methyltransferase TRM13 domain-containing protein n=1 Tax=Rhipicephalus microplus TaxID=6941 RepID=A0A9J6DYV6_RHIMP|nr:hypothetical protein HPB51_005241 [Rhipicephalus microplus]
MRTTDASCTLIDHALCNVGNDVHAGVLPVPIADHLPIFVTLTNEPINTKPSRGKLTTKIDYKLLQDKISQIDYCTMYDEDVNIEYSNFICSLKNAVSLSTTTTSSKYAKPLCPTMTPSILEILKQKDHWYHKWKQQRTNSYYLNQFKCYRNKSVTLMRKRKKEYYATLIREARGNTKQIWVIAKSTVGLDSDKRVLRDDITQDTVDRFNKYWEQFPDTTDHTHPIRPVSDSFAIFLIEMSHIMSLVKKLDANKAAWLDAITVKLIKNNINILADHLLHMFQHWYLCMGLSVERRAEVGRRCKLLLDSARAKYLSARRLTSRLVYFITPDVTPENVAIVATVPDVVAQMRMSSATFQLSDTPKEENLCSERQLELDS